MPAPGPRGLRGEAVRPPRWSVVLLALVSAPCGRPPMSSLACEDRIDCARWGEFAPYCRPPGVCSQCAVVLDCGPGRWTCTPNADGFGTCVPVPREPR